MDYKVAPVSAEWRTPPRVCRCCLSEGCYKDISSEYYWMGEKEIYAEMLKECFDLTISMQDVGSNGCLICEVCITRLRDASNFKKQVVSSEKRFSEHLKTGTSLADTSALQDRPLFGEIKIESIKDEEAVISDDDPPDPNDVDFDDDDYDESDSLPLKFEAQKKEAMTELSFGDEMPILSNSETTIKKVSARGKDSKALKKLKLNKKELTIKPVKAGGSRERAPKEPKVKAKPAKTAKKGPIYEFLEKSALKKSQELKRQQRATLTRNKSPASVAESTSNATYLASLDSKIGLRAPAKSRSDLKVRINIVTFLENSNMVPFRLGLSSFLCSYCGDPISDPVALREHTRRTHTSPKYSSVFFNLKKDQTVKVDLTDLSCALCLQPQADLTALKVHLQNVHGKQFDSSVGDGLMPFSLVQDDWRCYLCTNRFLSFRSLNSHMGEHFHNFVCESCGRGCMTQNELDSHIKTHAGEEVAKPKQKKKEFGHRCLRCPERFKYHDARNKHMVEVHGFEQYFYKCLECPKKFKRRSARHIHMQSAHNVGNNFACPQCGAMFVSKKRRDDHQARHARGHECADCGKVYSQRKTLREHAKVHARELQADAFGQPPPGPLASA